MRITIIIGAHISLLSFRSATHKVLGYIAMLEPTKMINFCLNAILKQPANNWSEKQLEETQAWRKLFVPL